MLSPFFPTSLLSSMYSSILPSYTLHPCHTPSFMDLFLPSINPSCHPYSISPSVYCPLDSSYPSYCSIHSPTSLSLPSTSYTSLHLPSSLPTSSHLIPSTLLSPTLSSLSSLSSLQDKPYHLPSLFTLHHTLPFLPHTSHPVLYSFPIPYSPYLPIYSATYS